VITYMFLIYAKRKEKQVDMTSGCPATHLFIQVAMVTALPFVCIPPGDCTLAVGNGE
jgi:hypothetical protein